MWTPDLDRRLRLSLDASRRKDWGIGYRLSEIASHLRCSYSTVSRRLRAWRVTECKT
jgi:transposase